MFIPEWIFWVAGIISVLAIAGKVSTPTGDYDFVAPILGLGVLLAAFAFLIGYLVGVVR